MCGAEPGGVEYFQFVWNAASSNTWRAEARLLCAIRYLHVLALEMYL